MRKKISLYLALFTAAAVVAVLLWQIHKIPSFASVKTSFHSTDRAILDRSGLLIDEIHRDGELRRLNWVTLKELPPFFSEALLQVNGLGNIAKEVSGMTGGGWPKILEVVWSRAEILEAYLNLMVYREDLHGLAAASFGLFDKAPQALSRSDAALLLGLIGADRVDTARVKSRACEFLSEVGAQDDCGLLPQQHLASLEKSYRIRPFLKMAPKLAVRMESIPEIAHGTMMRSTLDRRLQWSALHSLQSRDINRGAVIVLDNASGNVLAYVDSSSGNPSQDMAAHIAGATLKPLLYAKALDERVLTAATLLENSALLVGGKSRHRPKDLVTARAALAANLNVPALKVLELVGIEAFTKSLKQLGFSGFDQADAFGPSIALGAVDVGLLELTNAYRALINDGVWSPVRFSPDKLSEQAAAKVLSPEAAFIVRDILTDGDGRMEFSESEGGAADHWAIGFNQQFTVGVWTGNSVEPYAVWREVMQSLPKEEKGLDTKSPEALVHSEQEWFVAGTEPKTATMLASGSRAASRSHISYPHNHARIELAEEHIREGQSLLIQVAAPQPDQNLYLNGERLGRAKAFQPWNPHSGVFTLELRDSRGQVLDRVRFEVHGRSFAAKGTTSLFPLRCTRKRDVVPIAPLRAFS